MHASVKVLDIDIDMMTNDVFVQKMNEYLSDDKLDVILFASTELLDKAMGEESYREVIEQADLILPGEEALLSAHHVEVLEAGGMVVSCKSFGIMLENLQKKDQSVYIIGKSSTEVEQLETWCKRMQPGLRLSGSVVYDSDMRPQQLINENQQSYAGYFVGRFRDRAAGNLDHGAFAIAACASVRSDRRCGELDLG